MYRGRRHRNKQEQGDAEEFVHRLAEVRADMDEHPPQIIDLRELETHLRRVHIGTHASPGSSPKQPE